LEQAASWHFVVMPDTSPTRPEPSQFPTLIRHSQRRSTATPRAAAAIRCLRPGGNGYLWQTLVARAALAAFEEQAARG
jgi:hypothetical protein